MVFTWSLLDDLLGFVAFSWLVRGAMRISREPVTLIMTVKVTLMVTVTVILRRRAVRQRLDGSRYYCPGWSASVRQQHLSYYKILGYMGKKKLCISTTPLSVNLKRILNYIDLVSK